MRIPINNWNKWSDQHRCFFNTGQMLQNYHVFNSMCNEKNVSCATPTNRPQYTLLKCWYVTINIHVLHCSIVFCAVQCVMIVAIMHAYIRSIYGNRWKSNKVFLCGVYIFYFISKSGLPKYWCIDCTLLLVRSVEFIFDTCTCLSRWKRSNTLGQISFCWKINEYWRKTNQMLICIVEMHKWWIFD